MKLTRRRSRTALVCVWAVIMLSSCYLLLNESRNVVEMKAEDVNPVSSTSLLKSTDSSNPLNGGGQDQTQDILLVNVTTSEGIRSEHSVATSRQVTTRDESNQQQENKDQPGELGKAVTIKKSSLSPEDRHKYRTGWHKYQFNEYVSSLISLRRTLPDVRDPLCRNVSYPEDMPDASVVIIFYNEAWSVLLRTIYSILDRSPYHLLREIILVDDCSNLTRFEHLGDALEDFISRTPKVKLLRSVEHSGLIHARLLGAEAALGEVIVFLDSHCEACEGWLEPLLARIRENASNVVAPVIDVIDQDTFAYVVPGGSHVGGFTWKLTFSWHNLPERIKQNLKTAIDPQPSPTIAGGLFAINRAYFKHIGMYDPGKLYWGMENLEISFKVWMCGGSLEQIPCSHVGHVFRKHSPYSSRTLSDNVRRNGIRLAEVWMDQYKYYYYKEKQFYMVDYGDVTSRRELRKQLKCRSFRWYLDKIYPELEVPKENYDHLQQAGQIRNAVTPLCVDGGSVNLIEREGVKILPCHNFGGKQFWMLNSTGQVIRGETCIAYTPEYGVFVDFCNQTGKIDVWNYKNQHIQHRMSGLCIEMPLLGNMLTMRPCSASRLQMWNWEWFGT